MITAKRKGMDAKGLKPVGCQDVGKRPDFEVVFKMAVSEIVQLNNLNFFSQMIRYFLESLNTLSCWVVLIYGQGAKFRIKWFRFIQGYRDSAVILDKTDLYSHSVSRSGGSQSLELALRWLSRQAKKLFMLNFLYSSLF